MTFSSIDYLVFATIVIGVYWLLRQPRLQNPFLLVASFFFYGYIHYWFCLLLAGTIGVNFGAGVLMERYPRIRKTIAGIAVAATLCQLAFFKYFDFFIENVLALSAAAGIQLSEPSIRIFLPVGISFYSFQALSYTIDVLRGDLPVQRRFVHFALFVSFFPQLVAGPIERAGRLLPQIENPRRFDAERFLAAFPLLLVGLFKKLVVADNISVYVDKVFGLAQPPLALLLAGSVAFTIQIFADFSAYTDIARGSAKLLGFELMENFNAPYAALTPADFWRRWHISFSTWIRDYLYLPLGGSRNLDLKQQLGVLLVTFGLSGLWHGAAWNFVVWGIYHGVLLFVYRMAGMGARYAPRSMAERMSMWAVMLVFSVLGWMLFRASGMAWLMGALTAGRLGLSGDALVSACFIMLWSLFYAAPLPFIRRAMTWPALARGIVYGVLFTMILIFVRDSAQDFIYFQF